MLRAEVVSRKVARAQAWLADAEGALLLPVEAFLADARTRDLCAFHLMLAIQECVDLAAAWVSADQLSPPDSAGAAFDVLAGHGRIPVATAEAMRRAVGLRHRIAHGYAGIDARRLHDEAGPGVAAIRAYLAAVSGAAGL